MPFQEHNSYKYSCKCMYLHFAEFNLYRFIQTSLVIKNCTASRQNENANAIYSAVLDE
ncbi:hypothetical protein OAI40_01365 [Candidatus Pseudothioglobus singularis]|nr:hypothetical protein [Candidatus Pseudothioglobus singularis]